MNVSWSPIVAVDILGSVITLALAVCCAIVARDLTREKSDDVFRHYIFLLTLAIVFFAISRSFGHLVKQILLFSELGGIWHKIAPFSGAINTIAFVVIFAFGIYFHRFQKVHIQIEEYRNNLEVMIGRRTAELEEANVALAAEIVEHNHAARALKESQGYLQAILDNTTLPMYLKDISGQYILINKEYERIANWTNAEILGKNDRDVFPEAVAALFQSQDQEVKESGVAVEFEETITLADEEFTFLTSKFPLRDDGVIYAIGGVCTDITSRKKAEQRLAAEQERLAVTLRSIGDGVVTTDTIGNIISINKVAEELSGWRQDEVFGRPFEEVFHLLTPEREHYPNPIATIIDSGAIFALEERTILVSRHGQELFISDSGAPIRDKYSAIIGVVLVFRDVTQQLKLEEESLKIKKLESVGVLAGGIAHDFNNILAAIMGNISLARFDDNISEETQEMLAEAEKASLRARELTQQLLTFSKGGEPVKETASLQEVIEDSANFVLHGGKVICNFDFAGDLCLVDIDKGQISQVIQNIIINAQHAMPDGGVINVECANIDPDADSQDGAAVSAGLAGDDCRTKYVKIVISDTGGGIPASVIDKIFDPYFTTKRTGSGLGLAICHSIISKHRGNISVESVMGEATTFTITLPASDHAGQISTDVTEVMPTIPGTKILVMDDEEMVRGMTGAMLTRLGHEVIFAEDGHGAINQYRESIKSGQPIALTIMDLTIPGGMGGEEAVQEFLQIDAKAKVIVSSGYSNNPIMADYLERGFCAAIVKPYQYAELVRVVAEVLG